ncbi:MAG: transcription antitermination factor NusB [Alphaproteobacteria bacterium]|nr:transcription antitermination factor NusB [Alphaproteobacteria bacterium]
MSQNVSPAARRAARLAAVQALYQMELSGASSEAVAQDLLDGRLPLAESGPIDQDADIVLFRTIVEGAVAQQGPVDTMIARKLAEGWRLERLDSVARAILRAGVVELWRRDDIPTAVVIDEYVEIAKAFFEGAEPGFINGALDGCAKAIREEGLGGA